MVMMSVLNVSNNLVLPIYYTANLETKCLGSAWLISLLGPSALLSNQQKTTQQV